MDIDIIKLQVHGDDRGGLVALEENVNVPFTVKRVYYLIDTKKDVQRGHHAHRLLTQLVIAVRGSCRFLLDNGFERRTLTLDDPTRGLLLRPGLWREMFDFSEDCVLMILADRLYDETDYIRDYDAFRHYARQGQSD